MSKSLTLDEAQGGRLLPAAPCPECMSIANTWKGYSEAWAPQRPSDHDRVAAFGEAKKMESAWLRSAMSCDGYCRRANSLLDPKWRTPNKYAAELH